MSIMKIIVNVGIVGKQIGIWERKYYSGGAPQYEFVQSNLSLNDMQIDDFLTEIGRVTIE